jgi:hypothetical protein
MASFASEKINLAYSSSSLWSVMLPIFCELIIGGIRVSTLGVSSGMITWLSGIMKLLW